MRRRCRGSDQRRPKLNIGRQRRPAGGEMILPRPSQLLRLFAVVPVAHPAIVEISVARAERISPVTTLPAKQGGGMEIRWVMLAALLAPGAVMAQKVYKCEIDGQPTKYQSLPCDGQEAETEVPKYILQAQGRGNAPSSQRLAMIANCERDWPGDYRMQQHCAETQTKAASSLSVIMQRAEKSPALQAIMVTCAKQWEDGETMDFRMVQHCYETQEKAYGSMRRERGG